MGPRHVKQCIFEHPVLLILCSFVYVVIGESWVFAEPCVLDESVERLEVSLAVQESSENLIPVTFTLTVTNPSAEPVFLCFTSTMKYDFIVSKSGREVWRWSSGKMFAQVLLETALNPEETLQFSQSWEHKDFEDAGMHPGDYEVVSILYSNPEIITNPLPFRIPPESNND
jgi:hypothetical protein